MRIVLITQNDVFYLPRALTYLIDNFTEHSTIEAAVVLDVSPFGKRQSFLEKTLSTIEIFGPAFFVRYAWNYALAKLKGKDVFRVMREHEIPVIELDKPINAEESLERIRAYSPDLLISVAGNQVFKLPLIELPKKGTLNLHTALLPKYRGLMPSFWVMKNDEKETGVSVFFVDEGIDSGPILVHKRLEIGDKTQEQLIIEAKELGMQAIIEAVELIENGNYTLVDNDERAMTYYSFPTKADVQEFRRKGKRFF